MKFQLLFIFVGSLIWISTSTISEYIMDHSMENEVLKIGYEHSWHSPLYPAVQHTLIEDSILLNIFEPLLQRSINGTVLPLAAKGFDFSSDYQKLIFYIDSSKKFSDGSSLTSCDFKTSWERSLKIDPFSSNPSLRDVMNLIEGYDKFEKLGTISGLNCPDNETLIINFIKPFRMALMHLTGARFAAFKNVNNSYIGTGRFFILSQSDDEMILDLNPFSNEKSDFSKLIIKSSKNTTAELVDGSIDLIGLNGKRPPVESFISSTQGEEDAGQWLFLNGLSGRLFSDKQLRLAFQYLLWKQLNSSVSEYEQIDGLIRVDFQPYLPFSPGRLSKTEVDDIIYKGKEHLENLINLSRKNPVRICLSGDASEFIYQEIEESGLNIERIKLKSSEIIEEYYKKHNIDALLYVASIHTSDPDGLYHLLGAGGAITSPMIQRTPIAELLEQGRTLTDTSILKNHYQNATRTILNEVPGIHMGFLHKSTLFRNDRLILTEKITARHSDIFWKMFKKK